MATAWRTRFSKCPHCSTICLPLFRCWDSLFRTADAQVIKIVAKSGSKDRVLRALLATDNDSGQFFSAPIFKDESHCSNGACSSRGLEGLLEFLPMVVQYLLFCCFNPPALQAQQQCLVVLVEVYSAQLSCPPFAALTRTKSVCLQALSQVS